MKETRMEIALKVFQWNSEVADLPRVAKELGVSPFEFNRMSDDEFFKELFMYVHQKDTFIVS